MADDSDMPDADAVDEQHRQYPNRPKNVHKTLPFHDLFITLFNLLDENRKKPGRPAIARRKQGPHGRTNPSPHEVRRSIIEKFIGRWRKEVGNDFYPALRLILPDKDRDRAMYGLKEKAIGKLLVRVLKIDKNSEDGFNLLNWKLPGQKATAAMAGDFAGRCFDVISKRPMRTTVGDMSIAEVNEELDKLSFMSKDEDQLPVFQNFYQRMNAEEMMWLIRIILRQMKVGATEKTFLDIWHPDAETLFNVSSSLRRVCWELYDTRIRLDGENSAISLMQCFQPQLAAFQMHSFDKIASRMKPTEDDDAFWVEEKLDGERMQLHMVEGDSIPGGFRFNFWSRKAKDYTYLYGDSFKSEESALTRHIKNAFDPGVRNIILDGEMITWDMDVDHIVPFGTLKTAALSEQKNLFSDDSGQRPVYRVFDCLYLNDQPLTSFTLRDRRKALERSITSIPRRLEIHTYTEAHTAAEIEPLLRQVVAEASEGLVIKSPRSMYRLNERNDDWIKVKPEYMTEYGEALDCVIIGGYYGSGHRGGTLSSFLCGLRVDQIQIKKGALPMKCYSFFKVGGGFSKDDYKEIWHHTEGKWHKWDPKKPPNEFIELGGHAENRQYERPDVWIRADQSVVVSVKAASVSVSDEFRMNETLRFPRFTKLRLDKDWKSALSISEFVELKNSAELEKKQKETEFRIDESRRKKARTKKKPLVVAGSEVLKTAYGGPETKIFEGLAFFILTESLRPEKKSKAELEQMAKANGAQIVQRESTTDNLIIIADRPLLKVTSLQKHGKHNIVRPIWLFDCIRQAEADFGRPNLLLPYEPNRHMYFLKPDDQFQTEGNVDQYSDSYVRDVTADDHGLDFGALSSFMFRSVTIYLDKAPIHGSDQMLQQRSAEPALDLARNAVRFGGGKVTDDLNDTTITHVIVGQDRSRLKTIRETISRRTRLPRIVTRNWIDQSWREKTLLDEERFLPT
ncbi:DNA ligase 4 [Glonium stellatum]|uniref:DNA ligase n=1 Tax=Glonium stellatum TaxID=574774 RepID=A0A8E2ERQ4_9PEZI|nr:DNA ligase 4 [Glonium stellatum]